VNYVGNAMDLLMTFGTTLIFIFKPQTPVQSTFVSFGSTCMNEQASPVLKLNKSYRRPSVTDDHLGAALRPARTDQMPDYVIQLNISMRGQLCGHMHYRSSG
jgi:hypothetical protein